MPLDAIAVFEFFNVAGADEIFFRLGFFGDKTLDDVLLVEAADDRLCVAGKLLKNNLAKPLARIEADRLVDIVGDRDDELAFVARVNDAA